METFWFFRLRFRRAYDSAYDSDFWFSLSHKRSYDSAFDSDADSDSVASENHPLTCISSRITAHFWTSDENTASWPDKLRGTPDKYGWGRAECFQIFFTISDQIKAVLWRASWVRKWSNLPIRESRDRTPTERPSVHTTGKPMKITQSTGMATQTQLEVILAGNRIATRVTTKE